MQYILILFFSVGIETNAGPDLVRLHRFCKLFIYSALNRRLTYSVISFTIIKLLHVNAFPLNIAHQIALFADTIGFRFMI